MSDALPSGTVTFLFTDIEGSTRLWEQHPVAMREALARHDAILRQTIQAYAGMIFKTAGDGAHAAFARAPDASAAALAVQQALQTEAWGAIGSLRIRMALHTGVAEEREGDYFGPPLNRVARLMAAGHGGQILLTRATQELVCDDLPPQVTLRDLGTHRLKDLTRPEQIFQIIAHGLPSEFPPLMTIDMRRHNLPAQATALIGREQELTHIYTILRRADVRLVTLTGPGGTGKTRLGIQVAAELLDAFPDGVWFVNLAPINDLSLVASTIAQALDVRETGAQSLLDILKSYIRAKQLLLLLDNFEQLVEAIPLVSELLATAPKLKMLVTSRMPLHLSGEREFAVPPLALPDRTQPLEPELLTHYAAVQVFIERAQAVKADFVITNDTAPAVAEICYRLDGLPLAIELAATRVKLFPPHALLVRLQHRLQVLTGGARDLPERQQTLRNTIDWSYNLLDIEEQILFARLGVFAGGCTLEAAEEVCNIDSVVPFDIMDRIEALVDKSLLRQDEGTGGQPRFTMLETIREYALERLMASGEAERVRRRHAEYYLALAERARPQLEGPEQLVWINRLNIDQDNLRTALKESVEGNTTDVGGRLAIALGKFWDRCGHWNEGRAWIEKLLALPRETLTPTLVIALYQEGFGLARRQSDIARMTSLAHGQLSLCQAQDDQKGIARSLLNLAMLPHEQGDLTRAAVLIEESIQLWKMIGEKRGTAESLKYGAVIAEMRGVFEQATAYAEQSLLLCQEQGDMPGIAQSLKILGDIAFSREEHTHATALHEQCLKVRREIGDRVMIALALTDIASSVLQQGQHERAVALLQEALTLYEQLGDKYLISYTLNGLGEAARYCGDYTHAITCYEECLSLRRELGDKWGTAITLANLGGALLHQDNPEQAAERFAESLALSQEWSNRASRWTIIYLLGMAEVAVVRRRLALAIQLFGAASVLIETLSFHLGSSERADYNHYLIFARAQLDEATFATAWAEGRAMSLEQAIAYALHDDN